MKQRFFDLLRGRFLWYCSVPFSVLIASGIVAGLPPDDRFIYPLREIYLRLARLAYYPAVVVVLLTAAFMIPLLVSWSISQMEGLVGENLPNMRAYLALSLIAFLGYAQFGDTFRQRDTLDTLASATNTYLLVRQDSLADSDQFLIYACDAAQILCRQVHIQYGSLNGWSVDARLTANADGFRVENDGRILYEYPAQIGP